MLAGEGCPAYWGARAHVGPTQPNLGLDGLSGARESYVEFTPDIPGDLSLNVSGTRVPGGIFLQVDEPSTGTPVGWYDDGRAAAVDNVHGQGTTRASPGPGWALVFPSREVGDAHGSRSVAISEVRLTRPMACHGAILTPEAADV